MSVKTIDQPEVSSEELALWKTEVIKMQPMPDAFSKANEEAKGVNEESDNKIEGELNNEDGIKHIVATVAIGLIIILSLISLFFGS